MASSSSRNLPFFTKAWERQGLRGVRCRLRVSKGGGMRGKGYEGSPSRLASLVYMTQFGSWGGFPFLASNNNNNNENNENKNKSNTN